MAGFKRTNVQGHTIVADPELVKLLRRQASALLSRLFREAQEHGQSRIELDGKIYILVRQPDHTFVIEPESLHGHFV